MGSDISRDEELIAIRRSSLIKALRNIEVIVVSLDRLGSCAHEFSEQENNAMLARFFDEWNIFQKLADARMLLSEPFSVVLGEDDMSELEREFTDLHYWSFNRRKPPV